MIKPEISKKKRSTEEVSENPSFAVSLSAHQEGPNAAILFSARIAVDEFSGLKSIERGEILVTVLNPLKRISS